MTKQELEMCIEEYGKDIYSFCKHLTNNLSEADDLYQDTFLTAVELKEKIEYSSNPKSYLLSIALRIWKNKKRKFACLKGTYGKAEAAFPYVLSKWHIWRITFYPAENHACMQRWLLKDTNYRHIVIYRGIHRMSSFTVRFLR